jgi:hypothetical protein
MADDREGGSRPLVACDLRGMETWLITGASSGGGHIATPEL